MRKLTSRIGLFAGVCAMTLLAADMALAEVSAEAKFVSNPSSFLAQGFLVTFMAALPIGACVFTANLDLRIVPKHTIGAQRRVSKDGAALAADRAELGMEAYPGFGVGSQTL